MFPRKLIWFIGSYLIWALLFVPNIHASSPLPNILIICEDGSEDFNYIGNIDSILSYSEDCLSIDERLLARKPQLNIRDDRIGNAIIGPDNIEFVDQIDNLLANDRFNTSTSTCYTTIIEQGYGLFLAYQEMQPYCIPVLGNGWFSPNLKIIFDAQNGRYESLISLISFTIFGVFAGLKLAEQIFKTRKFTFFKKVAQKEINLFEFIILRLFLLLVIWVLFGVLLGFFPKIGSTINFKIDDWLQAFAWFIQPTTNEFIFRVALLSVLSGYAWKQIRLCKATLSINDGVAQPRFPPARE